MKNKAEPTWTIRETKVNALVPLVDYGGYFVDRFNDIYSARRKGKPLAPWLNSFSSGAVVERVTLFDNDGKRRQLSRRKVLIATLGFKEFEHREALRGNRINILEKEAKEAAIVAKQQEIESEKILADMHKPDGSRKAPLQTLDPFVADMVKEARKRKAQEALGGLF